ncbi:UNVERIFIED_CONTAM: hypothetical protein GTU68_044328 [Idotea baltica]|nr:hypothetical protein [Idotea baltica]
MLPFLESNW